MPASLPAARRRGAITCRTRSGTWTIEWETIRWPGETGKMLFHPRPERPTEPNAGILRLEPGAFHPEHYHGFAQVWYILKGEFRIDGTLCTPGAMLYHPDPHFEGEFHTDDRRRDPDRAVSRPDDGRAADLSGRFNMERAQGGR